MAKTSTTNIRTLVPISEKTKHFDRRFTFYFQNFLAELELLLANLDEQLKAKATGAILPFELDTLRHYYLAMVGSCRPDEQDWVLYLSQLEGGATPFFEHFEARLKAGLVRRTLAELMVIVLRLWKRRVEAWLDLVLMLKGKDQLSMLETLFAVLNIVGDEAFTFLVFLIMSRSESIEARILRHYYEDY
ncbi:hypothetical protein BJ508DRAFT_418613 [Ascobolus immersus RN42]|uniref:Uncharacterized protein n=1 Tax=Ascobolus immersus RN42 TaxID=1160509 RepID=A0A3N4HMI5_ASCIM|nr:hypothetical protein BJ508DRAFT_418613 [Ascobolus immersus RN42]